MKIFLLFIAAAPLLAQQPQLRIDLEGQWKIINGDGAAYANPEFDDRAWNTATIPFTQDRPFGFWWLRRTVDIPPAWTGSNDVGVTIGALNEFYELFVDGQRIAKVGEPRLSGFYIARPRVFHLPPNVLTRRLTIALRLWTPEGLRWNPSRSISTTFRDEGPWLIGTSAILPRDATAVSMGRRERAAIPQLIFGVMFGVLGSILVAGWLMQRSRLDLLAFAGFLLSEGYCLSIIYWGVALDLSHLSDMVGGLTLSISPLMLNYFLIHRRVPWSRWPLIPMWLTVACHLVLNTGISVANGSWLPGYDVLVFLTRISEVGLFTVAALAARRALRARDGNQCFLCAGVALFVALGAVGVDQILISGMSWSVRNFVALALAFALTLILIRELGAARQRLAQELQAARMVQQLLMPASGATNVDAFYLPAQEVGGDFWQALALPSGALLVVVGDVSGKGLRAAMVVSMVVGITRSNPHLGPAPLLEEINRVLLLGTPGGFVTCCAALFLPGGEVLLANAGHCLPFCEGREIQLPPGLPLGLTADGAWRETRISANGASLTFVSDGVIEAANRRGELFGFERTAAISIQPAHAIAEAARAWGQNDDITVVTVRTAAA